MKKDYTRAYTYIVAIATGMQTYLLTINLGVTASDVATAILLTVVAVFTILKQRGSIEINNNATFVTWLLIVVAIFGGINQIVQFFPISPLWQGRLKMIITGLIFMLNLVSKTIFPTQQGAIIQKTRNTLKATSNLKP